MLNITFGDKKSYDDFGMMLEKISIQFPEVKKNSVDIPAADGIFDMAEVFQDLKYGNRTIEMIFGLYGQYEDWSRQISEIAGALHGQKMRVILDTDPEYYYEGRLSVSTEKEDDVSHEIIITGDMQPYKMKIKETVIVCAAGTEKEVILHNGRKRLFPQITTTAETRFTFGGVSYSVGEGTHRILGLKLQPGDNHLTVTTTGTVTFRYREGDL
ncbi:Phage-related protein [uncultured Roseburia sp.]|uniref:Phage tail protein n=1 Tax=Brotonthovivens ammoniilytica TaxID=2981725 RepID=A0ABT2TMB8_9FIRM|nr:hypothetical protein [Brotonthovivens ammoniilytica]MCU6763372.1 hypothetical protein [Brotonthovivens ammoniilytica]SCJ15316.1 Phage-related protein [uncultured Roseburia sp.]